MKLLFLFMDCLCCYILKSIYVCKVIYVVSRGFKVGFAFLNLDPKYILSGEDCEYPAQIHFFPCWWSIVSAFLVPLYCLCSLKIVDYIYRSLFLVSTLLHWFFHLKPHSLGYCSFAVSFDVNINLSNFVLLQCSVGCSNSFASLYKL